jgi:probable HAF family extracellular repeat protein
VTLAGLNNWGMLAGCYTDETGTQQLFVQVGTHFSPVPFPLSGSLGACATGINNLGQLTGSYQDSVSSHGFMKTGDRIITIDVPADWGALFTGLTAINDLGTLVGIYETSDGATHGFVWIEGQFSKMETPEATALSPIPTALNNRGEIVGYYGVTSTVYPFYELRAFVSRAGNFTTLPVPGAIQPSPAINDRGEIVGSYTPSGCGNACTEVHGFLAEPVPE